MFMTADQLLAHLAGDYVIQSDWMANEKTKKSVAAAAHALSYSLPFLFLTTSWKAMAVIVVTHFVIDRWRLARYVCWAKNFLSPFGAASQPFLHKGVHAPGPALKDDDGEYLSPLRVASWNYPWHECVGTGYHKDRPPWLAVWLLIIADNTMHLVCNAAALRWLS